MQHELRGERVDVELVEAYPGNFSPIAATRSSQYGMEMEMPLLFVADVRCLFGRRLACSKA